MKAGDRLTLYKALSMNTLQVINPKSEVAFPVATKAGERFSIKSVPGSWAKYKEELGITKDTPKAEVKAHQAQYNASVDAHRKAARAALGMLATDARFGRINIQTWTDSRGYKAWSAKGSEAPIKPAGGKGGAGSATLLAQEAQKTLNAAAEKLVAGGKFATLEEAKAFLS